MPEKLHDIVVVGAGHNTLVTAAYLTRCGLDVLVLEKNDIPGGGTVSRFATVPGFVHDIHATGMAHLQTHPIVTHDELELLSKYGLEFVYPEISFMTIFSDGDSISCFNDLDRTCHEIARFSEKDAVSYRRMAEFMAKVGPLMDMSLARPPSSFGSFLSFLEQAPFGNELIMALLKSTYDVVVENFEHPKVQMHFLKWASEAVVAPEEKTTGINMFFLIGASHSRPAGATVGGTGKITAAIIRSIEDHGGEVRVNSKVRRILNRNGVAKAVEMEDGSVIEARRAVVAAIHPHLLGDMVEGLDEGLVRRARATHPSSYAELTIHGALKEKVNWKVGTQPDSCLAINLVEHSDMESFRRVFDDLKYGDLPKSFIGCVGLHTNYDPSRAPAGKHSFYFNGFVPFEPRGGGWTTALKEKHAAWCIDKVSSFTTNLSTDSFEGIYVESPLDMVAHSPSFQCGDIMGLGSYAYQALGLRPTAELSGYRVPGASGLYLSGPFMHPGGGVTGGGRAVAMRIMDDIEVDYSKVMRS